MRANPEKQAHRASPYINVTPLIDVLLVLLIIFMVATPLKPSRFKMLVPEPPTQQDIESIPGDLALVVTIEPDLSLRLNQTGDMGTTSDPGKLSLTLAELFRRREELRTSGREMPGYVALPESVSAIKIVFIKAPRSISYGEVVRVIDGIKIAGANPVGLQIDDLN
jgi:biopolymer transport protein ExbD